MNYDAKTESLEIIPNNTTIVRNNDNPIQSLPTWSLNNSHPAFYDSESATAIEQTARVYGKLQEMIALMNNFTSTIKEAENEHKNEVEQKLNYFVECMQEKMLNHINCIDMKIENQNKKINSAIDYMTTNIVITTENVINEAIKNGTIYIDYVYDPENESLKLITSNTEGGI